MKATHIVATLGATAVLGGGVFAVPAVAGPHHTGARHTGTTHTITLISVTKTSVGFGKNKGGSEDIDQNSAGKTIGFDTLQATFDPATASGKGAVAINLAGGFVYSTLEFSNNTMGGTVVGGTGLYKGAHGHLVATNLNKSGTRTAVTITYTN